MSKSITINAPVADPGFKVNASIQHVRASQGEQSNSVQVNNATTGAKSSPAPVTADQPAAVHGETVMTTFGTAKVHRTVAGETLVTLPGPKGVQVTMKEAEAAGLIVREQAAPAKTNEETKPNSQAADSEDQADNLPTVTADDLKAHAVEINAAGDALENAGINPEEGLSRAVQVAVTTGEMPEDVTDALVGAFGDDAQTIVDNAYHHATAVTADILNEVGISVKDLATMGALQNHLNANPAAIPAYVQALQGNVRPLRSLIGDFALARSRRS